MNHRKTKRQKIQKLKDSKNIEDDNFIDDEVIDDEEEERFDLKRKIPQKMNGKNSKEEEEEDLNNGETADEKRLRMAKEFLLKLGNEEKEENEKEEEREEFDEDFAENEEQRNLMAKKLRDSATTSKKRFFKKIADTIPKNLNEITIQSVKKHKLPITSVVITQDETTSYSASKDCCIIRWDVETAKKIFEIKPGTKGKVTDEGHFGNILALAISSDGKHLASAGTDKLIKVWDTRSNTLIDSFKGHRGAISALSFRMNTHELYSGSDDRTIKIWNTDDMNYIDTLYGHQSEVMGLDSLVRERAISCGRDTSVRIWKILEETQLLFKGHTSSIDCVNFITEDSFVSGSDDGSIAVWNTSKKKPLQLIKKAHGGEWISSISACKYSDLIASGSSNGFLKLWKYNNDSLISILDIPLKGFINGVAFGQSGRILVAGGGQEHRLGRWSRIKEAKNEIHFIRLLSSSQQTS